MKIFFPYWPYASVCLYNENRDTVKPVLFKEHAGNRKDRTVIKSTIRKSEYQEIYRLLDSVSPLSRDCGELCGAVCCGTDDETWTGSPEFSSSEDHSAPDPENDREIGIAAEETPEMGIYLLPGEEKLHRKKGGWLTWSEERAEDYAFPDSWKGTVYFVRCKTPPHCPREKRPIQCRTFPLAPHFMEDDRLVMILNDLELPYRCPLIADKMTLNPDFLKTTHHCWERLVKDPLIHDLVRMDSDERSVSGSRIVTIYDPASS